MSGFAFSHQFSQRWLDTPSPVKQAIINELDDIITVLQPQTDPATFQFRTSNLHAEVEDLMQDENQRLAKIREEQEKQQRLEQARLERQKEERLAQQRREEERLEQERIEKERLEKERIEKEQQEQQRLADQQREQELLEKQQSEQHLTELANAQQLANQSQSTTQNQTQQNFVNQPKPTLDSATIEQIKEQIITALQEHIDNFLLENLSETQQNLSNWLRQEVDRQVAEKVDVASK